MEEEREKLRCESGLGKLCQGRYLWIRSVSVRYVLVVGGVPAERSAQRSNAAAVGLCAGIPHQYFDEFL